MITPEDPEVIVTAEHCDQACRVFWYLKYYCCGVFEKAKAEQRSHSDSLSSLVVKDLPQQLAIAKDLEISIMVTLYQEWIDEVTTEMVNKQKQAAKIDTAKARKGRSADTWVVVKSPKEDDWEMVET